MGTVYILKNKVNKKCYVGQTTKSFETRLKQHHQKNNIISKAIQKYGFENFDKILFEDVPEDQLDYLEQENIIKYDSISPNGYNLESGGHDNKHHCEESKKKMSESHMGQVPWMKGKTHTEEAKEKISEANMGNTKWLGRHHTDESNEKNRDAHIGNTTWMKGKHHTDETKLKMSLAKKGKTTWMKGKHHTEEAKEKNRLAHLGNTPSNKGKRTPHPCPICGEQRKEKYVGGEFKAYLKTCGERSCITLSRRKK